MNRRSAISSGTISLLIARIIYAINWFNIGSLFTFISKEFNQDVSYLGQLSGFFLLGIGLFQIPGGLFATKFGSRRSAILGILLSSIAVIISSLTTQIAVFVILRFIVGLGMAFFFSAWCYSYYYLSWKTVRRYRDRTFKFISGNRRNNRYFWLDSC